MAGTLGGAINDISQLVNLIFPSKTARAQKEAELLNAQNQQAQARFMQGFLQNPANQPVLEAPLRRPLLENQNLESTGRYTEANMGNVKAQTEGHRIANQYAPALAMSGIGAQQEQTAGAKQQREFGAADRSNMLADIAALGNGAQSPVGMHYNEQKAQQEADQKRATQTNAAHMLSTGALMPTDVTGKPNPLYAFMLDQGFPGYTPPVDQEALVRKQNAEKAMAMMGQLKHAKSPNNAGESALAGNIVSDWVGKAQPKASVLDVASRSLLGPNPMPAKPQTQPYTSNQPPLPQIPSMDTPTPATTQVKPGQKLLESFIGRTGTFAAPDYTPMQMAPPPQIQNYVSPQVQQGDPYNIQAMIQALIQQLSTQ